MGFLSELSTLQRSGARSLSPPATIFLLVEGCPWRQYLPHTFGLLLHMDKASSHSIRGKPWGRKKTVQAGRGMLSAGLWACLERSTTAVSEIRDQGMFCEVSKLLGAISLTTFWREFSLLRDRVLWSFHQSYDGYYTLFLIADIHVCV